MTSIGSANQRKCDPLGSYLLYSIPLVAVGGNNWYLYIIHWFSIFIVCVCVCCVCVLCVKIFQTGIDGIYPFFINLSPAYPLKLLTSTFYCEAESPEIDHLFIDPLTLWSLPFTHTHTHTDTLVMMSLGPLDWKLLITKYQTNTWVRAHEEHCITPYTNYETQGGEKNTSQSLSLFGTVLCLYTE